MPRLTEHQVKQKKGIGYVSNYYGGLHILEHEGRFYWVIENYDTDFRDLEDWEEIDEQLYRALVEFDEREEARNAQKQKEQAK